MAIPEGFDIGPVNKLNIDTPNIPFFRYTESERQERLDQGMTEDQITADEVARAARIRENQNKRAA